MNRDEYPLHTHLQTLVTLLYGLALATGLEYAVPKAFDGCLAQDLAYIPLACAAFAVGLSDWAVYHRFAATRHYRNLARVLLDILFPVLVYVLFVAAAQTERFLLSLVAYCFLSMVYLWLLRREGLPASASLGWLYGASLVVALLLFIWGGPVGLLAWPYTNCVFAGLLVLSWAVVSGRLALPQLSLEWHRAQVP